MTFTREYLESLNTAELGDLAMTVDLSALSLGDLNYILLALDAQDNMRKKELNRLHKERLALKQWTEKVEAAQNKAWHDQRIRQAA